MRILGIETSCDETGIAIFDQKQGLLAEALHSQASLHARFGGVVPELASRDHIQRLLPLVQKVLDDASCTLQDLDGIAYTKGPGLQGALLVGAMFARALGFALNCKTIGVHHLEGHLLSAFLSQQAPTFPFIAGLFSGGHTMLVRVDGLGQYTVLGETLDDAVGEAFDKTAKLLGLPYPGGARLSALAQQGAPDRFYFPRPLVKHAGLNFSFSGLKTHVAQIIAKQTIKDYPDIARAFEEAAVDTIVTKCKRALKETGIKQLVLGGGVTANTHLRAALTQFAAASDITLSFPEPKWCTDNGAMIAYVGALRLAAGEEEPLSVVVKPRFPLSEVRPLL